jgi:hypothetical protein
MVRDFFSSANKRMEMGGMTMSMMMLFELNSGAKTPSIRSILCA